MKTVLITGAAGFIGYSLAKHLLGLENGNYKIVGIDNINNYYDIDLKINRIKQLKGISFIKKDINDNLDDIFEKFDIDTVVNLAAQAGVRYSRENPDVYIESNIDGFYNLLKTSQAYKVKKFIYASSSSIYGANTTLPFKESHQTATPMSLYAATKLSNEVLASGFFYSHGIRTIGLRFFNIYGPFGRPDMAYYKWTTSLEQGRQIELNNNGEMWRDMTYIDDCVRVIEGLLEDNVSEDTPEVYNVGNKEPVKIADLLQYIATQLNIEPDIKITKAGAEEPIRTWADTTKIERKIGFAPNTGFQYGIKEFLEWYKKYYGV